MGNVNMNGEESIIRARDEGTRPTLTKIEELKLEKASEIYYIEQVTHESLNVLLVGGQFAAIKVFELFPNFKEKEPLYCSDDEGSCKCIRYLKKKKLVISSHSKQCLMLWSVPELQRIRSISLLSVKMDRSKNEIYRFVEFNERSLVAAVSWKGLWMVEDYDKEKWSIHKLVEEKKNFRSLHKLKTEPSVVCGGWNPYDIALYDRNLGKLRRFEMEHSGSVYWLTSYLADSKDEINNDKVERIVSSSIDFKVVVWTIGGIVIKRLDCGECAISLLHVGGPNFVLGGDKNVFSINLESSTHRKEASNVSTFWIYSLTWIIKKGSDKLRMVTSTREGRLTSFKVNGLARTGVDSFVDRDLQERVQYVLENFVELENDFEIKSSHFQDTKLRKILLLL